jgi:hypothetical protein
LPKRATAGLLEIWQFLIIVSVGNKHIKAIDNSYAWAPLVDEAQKVAGQGGR